MHVSFVIQAFFVVLWSTATAFLYGRPQRLLASQQKGFSLYVLRYEVKEEESIDDALRFFRQACSQSGHLQALRNKDQFENRVEKQKRKREQARFLNKIARNNDRYENNYFGRSDYKFDKK